MKEVVVSLASGADPSTLSSDDLAKIVVEEVDGFSKFMEKELPDWKYRGPLTRAERVLLQTYLAQKLAKKVE